MSEPTRGKIIDARVRGGRTLATVMLANGDTRTRVELMMPYGVSAIPEAGSDIIILEMGGNRDHLVALMADTTSLRVPNLAPGEVGIRDKRGQQVVLRSDGVEITGALKVTIISAGSVEVEATSVTIDSPTVTMSGNLVVEGAITAVTDISSGTISLRNHRHNDADGTTDPPF